MRVLFDLNVLIDVACRWRRFPDSMDLYNRILAGADHEGALPACGYTTLYYVMGQLISETEARAMLDHFRKNLRILPFSESTAAAAHLLRMKDFEDACIAATAFEGRCGVIATRDPGDYATSPIPARTPAQVLREI